MQKLALMLILGSLLVNMFVLQAEIQSNPFLGTRRVTKLRFYVQDIVGGDRKTVWRVAQSNLTDVLPSHFGSISVLDNLVTSGPEIESEEVGRIQGMISLSDFHETSLAMLLNVVFTKGEFEGSTLSILGRNPLFDEVREVPIVGGTGAFRMATGYVITRTYSLDKAHIRNVYEYNVTVLHMDDTIFMSH